MLQAFDLRKGDALRYFLGQLVGWCVIVSVVCGCVGLLACALRFMLVSWGLA